MDKAEETFLYLREKFPHLSEAKIKEGIFVGPQIHKLYKDEHFNTILIGDEKFACDTFVQLSTNFLGNKRAENCKDLLANLHCYSRLGCNMSLKIHFLHSHLDYFADNCGAVSDEHLQICFHLQISNVEMRYQGKWSASMLANYCWTLIRESLEENYKCQAKRLRLQ